MEREFALISLKGLTKPFDLNNLTIGRMDLIARCISSAFFISYAIRRNVIFNIFLYGPPDPPKNIILCGEELEGISPDEKGICRKISEVLKKSKNLKLNEIKKIEKGIYVGRRSFENFIKQKAGEKNIIYLHPKGKDIREYEFKKSFLFVLGDQKGLPEKTEKLLENLGAEKVSLGKIEYLASHCIVIVNNELDRRGL
ncbi:MAG: tRNA (pseudouridine(54)-N(1))-methyltransferase TrmY [Candidatus Aenigmatarchaeota archaeon]